MTREELKEYKYNKEYIKDLLFQLEEEKTEIEKVTSMLSDMPKRKF